MLTDNPARQSLTPEPLTAKRSIDILLALAVLPFALPLYIVTAAIVHICLGRPIFFRQQRAGRNMRTFEVLKFRTMTDTRGADGRLLPDEQRQTPATALLRRLRLDELPQLLCVLRGDMSLVGPRPLPKETIEKFGDIGALRSMVRPGVTGWAQVNGNTRLSDEQKVALDVWYVDNQSLAMDVSIMVMTAATIFLGERVANINVQRANVHLRHRRALTLSGGE